MIGLATTPLAPEDADGVVALWRECEQIDQGEASRTGALGRYERVGMRVKRSYTRYAKPL